MSPCLRAQQAAPLQSVLNAEFFGDIRGHDRREMTLGEVLVVAQLAALFLLPRTIATGRQSSAASLHELPAV
jgi:hypothetical protein